MPIRFELLEEFRISAQQNESIRLLVRDSFPNEQFTSSRNYFKQLPQRRLLAWQDDSLIGHMGVEHRVVGLSTGPATVFGVIDVCVHSSARGQGLASEMLQQLERLGRTHQIDFMILFAADDRLYLKNGYRRARNRLRWLKIHEHETLGIGEEIVDEFRIKEIGDRAWPDGPVDLLGYLF